MATIDIHLVKGDTSNDIYVIDNKKRRVIPDTPALLALTSEAYQDIAVLPQDKLTAIPLGPPMPSFVEGTVLMLPNGKAFVIKAGKLTSVPDEQALATLSRKQVYAITDIDLKFLAGTIEDSVPGISTASPESIAISSYLRTLAPLPAEPSGETRGT